MTLTLDGMTYRISPGGRVSVAYRHPATSTRTLWRRLELGSALSRRVRVAAGVEAPAQPPAPRKRSRLYSDRHCI